MPVTIKTAQFKYKNGEGEYVGVNAIGDEDAIAEIDSWLDRHPEATTTVVDGSITYNKLNAEVSGDISDLKDAVSSMTAATASDAGKALKAKTVSGGKVTEWEFGETVVVDDTLTQTGEAADAKETGDALAVKINKPTTSPDGTSGQLLRTNGDGTTQWVDQGLPTDEQTADAVEAWLDDHPEATTTVQDGSITYAKLHSDVSRDIKSLQETDETDTNLDIADAQGYVLVRFYNGHIKTKNFDSSEIGDMLESVSVGFEYKFSGNDLLIAYGYNATYDAVVVLNRGRANNLFDFSALKLKPKGEPLSDFETADLTNVWTSGTDMHAPFQFLVNNNADGYHADATDADFTGGNHVLTINGSAVTTASSEYVLYFADGKPVSDGFGKCNRFEIRWANNIQAYNCVKADGTGRSSLTEIHDMIFDGVEFKEEIRLIPLEEITMRRWYGLQSVSWGSTYTDIAFVDGENRDIYSSPESSVSSGNAITSGMIQKGQSHSLEMKIDTTCDLGKRPFYSGTSGAFTSNGASKTYFTIITGTRIMQANTMYLLRGSYRFFPSVA